MFTAKRGKVAARTGIPPQAFAHTLVTEYRPGAGLGWHRDIVLRDEIRWGWQHSVSPTPALRYSITFRTRR